MYDCDLVFRSQENGKVYERKHTELLEIILGATVEVGVVPWKPGGELCVLQIKAIHMPTPDSCTVLLGIPEGAPENYAKKAMRVCTYDKAWKVFDRMDQVGSHCPPYW